MNGNFIVAVDKCTGIYMLVYAGCVCKIVTVRDYILDACKWMFLTSGDCSLCLYPRTADGNELIVKTGIKHLFSFWD